MSADSHHPISEAIARQAAAWLARRDRGLTAAEQDAYIQWLGADPRHAEAMAQHAAAFERMMQLYEWQPSQTSEPNPNLFAPVAARRGARWWWSTGLAAAAAATLALGLLWQKPWAPPAPVRSYLRVNEQLALPDGSRVELKDGSHVVVQYSAAERRVKLTGGEAHFTVRKDAARPFVVDAAGVEVHAVGTAFNVRLDGHAVEVLVTEGRVKVEAPAAAEVPVVSEGERAVVALAEPAPDSVPAIAPPPPEVFSVSPEQVSRELAWQAPRLQFDETPLTEAVGEFNRLNRHQLVIADPELKAQRIGGTFRPDNVEGFVRLLHETLGIRAEPEGADRTVLRAGR